MTVPDKVTAALRAAAASHATLRSYLDTTAATVSWALDIGETVAKDELGWAISLAASAAIETRPELRAELDRLGARSNHRLAAKQRVRDFVPPAANPFERLPPPVESRWRETYFTVILNP